MDLNPAFFVPQNLWALLAVPALVAFYVHLLRRKKKAALRFPSLRDVKEALDRSNGFRRHAPPALLIIAITLALVAFARPAVFLTLPSQQSQIILAMDVSISMRAEDVEPDRITAAKNAAKAFIEDMPSSTRIGIVAFAGTAMLTQEPTGDRQMLIAAVDGFRLQRATNIGGAILAALKALFPSMEFDIALPDYQRDWRRTLGRSLDQPEIPPSEQYVPVPPGSYKAAAVILLTDGQATTGPDPLAAARVAADRGVRIFTVGLGSLRGEIASYEGRRLRVRIDEESLKAIADITKAKYFFAGSGAALTDIYKELNSQFILERKETEVSSIFAALASLFMVVAAGLSLAWSSRF